MGFHSPHHRHQSSREEHELPEHQDTLTLNMGTGTCTNRSNGDEVPLAEESDSSDGEVMLPTETDSNTEIDDVIYRKTEEPLKVDSSYDEQDLIWRSRCGRS